MMKRIVYPLVILSLLLFACKFSLPVTLPLVATAMGASDTPAATEPTLAPKSPTKPLTSAPLITPTATATPQPSDTPTATEPPLATEPPALQANVACNELALFLAPVLASGFECQTLPEINGQDSPGFEVNPQYTELTLTGYVLSDRFFTPKIYVYPVPRFVELLPDVIPPEVSALQALIGGGSSGGTGLPFLPNFNAGQEFFAQYKVISFGSGGGIRYLTQYSQYFDPINNHELFYTFQGLTSDGKYWVSAILPISNPLLPEDGNNPPDGQSQEEFANNFPTYIADLTAQLNAQPSGNYSPAISVLDALVSSIQTQP